MYCSKCKTKLTNGVKFCSFCGTPVDMKISKKPNNKRNVLVYALAAIVPSIVLVSIGSFVLLNIFFGGGDTGGMIEPMLSSEIMRGNVNISTETDYRGNELSIENRAEFGYYADTIQQNMQVLMRIRPGSVYRRGTWFIDSENRLWLIGIPEAGYQLFMENVESVYFTGWHDFAITTNRELWRLFPEVQERYSVKLLNDIASIHDVHGHEIYAISTNNNLYRISSILGEHEQIERVKEGVIHVNDGLAITICNNLWEINNPWVVRQEPVHLKSNVRYATRIWGRSSAEVAMYERFTYWAITTDDGLWSWGFNQNGVLGDGTRESRSNPVKIKDDVSSILFPSNMTVYALTNDNTLWGWGRSQRYTTILGDGTWDTQLLPVQIMSDVQEMVSTGRIITTNNELWGWGGVVCSHGISARRLNPVHMMDDVVSFSAGMVIRLDGTLLNIGGGAHRIEILENVHSFHTNRKPHEFERISFIVTNDGALWAMGANHYGQLGDGTFMDRADPVMIKSGASSFDQPERSPEPSAIDGTWEHNTHHPIYENRFAIAITFEGSYFMAHHYEMERINGGVIPVRGRPPWGTHGAISTSLGGGGGGGRGGIYSRISVYGTFTVLHNRIELVFSDGTKQELGYLQTENTLFLGYRIYSIQLYRR